jgi:chaperone modulatory protein CbpM
VFTEEEFCLQVGIERRTLRVWVDEGWLAPQRDDADLVLSEMDAARARLIRDLREGMGVNDEGIGIVLDLLDQLHGLRGALQRVSTALQALPEPLRQEILARLQGRQDEAAGHMGGESPSGAG